MIRWTLLVSSILWGVIMTATASEIGYRFAGNRWTDQHHHSVSTLAELTVDGTIRANVIVKNKRISELPWRVHFWVGLHEHLVFDGAVYKVTAITLDLEVRERIRKANEGEARLLPGGGDIRDVVAVTKVADAVFDQGQMVLPVTPSVLYFSVTARGELEVIFDGVKVTSAQSRVASIRWRIVKQYDFSNPDVVQDAYQIVEAEPGELADLPGVGKLKIDDIIAASEHHPAWLVLRVLRNPPL